ncbi:MAG: hypothetical protein NTV88_04080 [Candidatus Micrarchaeota archaeon]|nr:hypothetical protein [Candidatus Micrarchaeota archaeon]
MPFLFQMQAAVADMAHSAKQAIKLINEPGLDIERITMVPKPYDNMIECRIPVTKKGLLTNDEKFVSNVQKAVEKLTTGMPVNVKSVEMAKTFSFTSGGGKEILIKMQVLEG